MFKINSFVKNQTMINCELLKEMKNKNFEDLNSNELVDIKNIEIDTSKPKIEKLIDFIETIKNPYLFKVGDIIVKIKFSNNNQSFQEKMENIILGKMQN